MANRGYYVTPHVVKEIQDTVLDTLYTKKHYTKVDPKYYTYVADGMRGAVMGTAYGATCRGQTYRILRFVGKRVR